MKQRKKANAVGIGILAMAALLLLGSIFIDDNNISKSDYYKYKKDYHVNNYSEDYLFYLEEVDIGRQKKVTQSFPNIELGSKTEYDIIYMGSSFRLNSNPFSRGNYSFNVAVENPENTNELLLYFDTERISGEELINVYVNGILKATTSAKKTQMPVIINDVNQKLNVFTFELIKPRWYDIFNWNKVDIENFKAVEVKQNRQNNIREFNFQADEEDLERIYVDLVIKCDDIKEISEAIKVEVNGYIVSNENPNCISRNTKITANIPLEILNEEKNSLILETEGFYTLAYSINKITFNDKQVYKFTINSFNDIIDVVMYGDFDKEFLDVKLNEYRITLERDEILSVIQYLKFGTNEIEFLEKPVEIKEFAIEKTDYWN